VARAALQRTDEYCCGLARRADPQSGVVASLDDVIARKPDALLDLTTQPGSFAISMAAVERGLPTVVGASGWSEEQRAALDRAARKRDVGALLVPNFSIGAALMMRFAETAARYFKDAEIVELHHASKKDRPSGTAKETAALIERAAGQSPAVHSVRLPGLLAHQRVLFGGTGELLTIAHDSFTRESFVAGMRAALRAVVQRRGLAIGLDCVLDAAEGPG
ncbi:MAG: 4-hydroxy-tetrahydrodipicolinate reductase, partial [Candidatus Eremiobacteraeota bacterium]|nr:4-hydroxy-tetrahydrodipicolinate reductase [Candidatus Eremiobacteraeota bacterium]